MYSPLYVLAGYFLLFMFHYVFAIENVLFTAQHVSGVTCPLLPSLNK